MSITNTHDHKVASLRRFTLEEANRSLVLVQRIVADVVCSYNRLLDLQEVIEAAEFSHQPGRGQQAQAQLVKHATQLQGYTAELDELGVELRDWAAGVVDFPCIIDGRDACFCWRLGEEKVFYYRQPGEAEDIRHPIDELTGNPA